MSERIKTIEEGGFKIVVDTVHHCMHVRRPGEAKDDDDKRFTVHETIDVNDSIEKRDALHEWQVLIDVNTYGDIIAVEIL